MVQINRLSNGALAGMAVGFLMGIGARIAMRIVALLGNSQPDFSFVGTVGILMLFTLAGLPFGVIFAGMHLLVRLRAQIWGGIYGLIFALVACIPFLNDPGGEFALASPWVGILLFAPLPLIGGVLLGLITPALEQRTAGAAQRSVHIGWLAGMTVAVILAFMSMGTLMDGGTRMPRALWDLYSAAGIPTPQAIGISGLIGFVVMLGYVGGLTGIFFAAGQHRAARLAALALLLFAAGFFSQRGIFTGMMDSLRMAALAAALIKTVGATGLTFLLHTFPDGRFTWPWSRPLVMTVVVGALIWFMLPVMGAQPAAWIPEGLRLLAVTAILGSGVAALALRVQRADTELRRQIATPSLGLAAVVICFLGLWTAMLLSPKLGFSGLIAPFAPLSVPIYLLPWLLPPLLMLHAVLRRSLWSVVQ
ncbi:MAG: hypothetical protein KF893_25185 [Caldilineaceae bacterium]|nr:hypothetical protein [Caldilineaceae bacterium]